MTQHHRGPNPSGVGASGGGAALLLWASVALIVGGCKENTNADAVAGPDQTVTVGDTVEVEGFIRGGEFEDLMWEFVSRPAGSTAMLEEGSGQRGVFLQASFVADVEGVFELEFSAVLDEPDASPGLPVLRDRLLVTAEPEGGDPMGDTTPVEVQLQDPDGAAIAGDSFIEVAGARTDCVDAPRCEESVPLETTTVTLGVSDEPANPVRFAFWSECSRAVGGSFADPESITISQAMNPIEVTGLDGRAVRCIAIVDPVLDACPTPTISVERAAPGDNVPVLPTPDPQTDAAVPGSVAGTPNVTAVYHAASGDALRIISDTDVSDYACRLDTDWTPGGADTTFTTFEDPDGPCEAWMATDSSTTFDMLGFPNEILFPPFDGATDTDEYRFVRIEVSSGEVACATTTTVIAVRNPAPP